MKKLDLRLLRMIKTTKGQFISITVIIAAALCIYMLFGMTNVNIRNTVDFYYDLTNINDIQVQLIRIPQGALKEINTIEGIKEVQGRISFDVPLSVQNKDEKVSVRIISLPSDGEKINKLYYMNGKDSAVDSDSVILLEQFAKARNIRPGDVIAPYINGREHKLNVSAIAASPEFIYLMENDQSLMPANEKFGVAYVNEAFAQSLYGYRGSYNEVLITLEKGSNIDDVVEVIEKKLDKYGVKRIIKLEDQLSNNVLTQKMDGIEQMAAAIPVMFLGVASIIISIMLSRIVNNDRMAIGVLKAMGYGNIGVLSHYIKYSLMIGMTGSIIGILGGLLLSRPFTNIFVLYFNIPVIRMEIYYSYMIKAILLTSMFCIASGLFGAKSVIRIMPADSLRPEAPKSGKRILLERMGFVWHRLSFSWKMVIRNIARTKRRFILLVFGLALTYAINTVPLYEGVAIPQMFNLQYGVYQKMDYAIDFTHPMSKSVMVDLKKLIDVEHMEAKIEYPFKLTNGWRERNVFIIGVPQDTSFYEFRDSSQRTVSLEPNRIFITKALSKTLNVQQGDTLKIKNFLPGKKDVEVEIGGVIEQYMGVNAYMEIETMERLLTEKNLITGVTLASQDQIKDKLKDVKNIASINSVADMKTAFLEFLDTMILATRLYLLFGGVLGFAIIYNSTIVGISERNMEFASLRILGFDKNDIFWMITRENALMALAAILVGIPMGMGIIKGFAESFSSEVITFPIILSAEIFITAAVATVFFVSIAQLAAYKKIHSLNFIDALKSRIS
ncbi:putative ABC transport system permease protein [Geosporobacter subterraneus DSM 17957]|uniref:Putative ABC transport system permease protein n=1 Tax=Geosporobacter subterraneus DSM 17957 TaxID=1121919 RepID=A0A1M6P4L7_9FIRM|nr:FtsX-like permease family protein [Geosporobacter subterraneus]SHK02907.1 putative ABC transport system permease protein [Geosporobacter subterraneus DSM 17957]